jgi:hypothetical protein
MALLFMDGCSHYSTAAQYAEKWGAYNANYAIPGSTNPRRTGGKHLAVGSYGNASYAVGSVKSTLVAGCAFYTVGLLTGAYPISFMRNGTITVAVRFNANGSISVVSNNESTVLGTTVVDVVTGSAWYYLEFKCTPDNSGDYEVWVNGVSVLAGTGDTQTDSASGVDEIRFSGAQGGTNFTDLYIDDSTQHGDCRIETVMPNAAGTYSQFTPTPSGQNSANVDDAGAIDEDTTYNASNTAGQKDTFDLEDISDISGSVIKGVQLNLTMRKDDAGNRTVTPYLRAGSADYPNAAPVIVADVYRMWKWIYETHPDTDPWDRTNFNALEAGYKLVS